MDHLHARIAEHDRDIERMCNFHYQGFVDSIGELLKVRKHAEKLKVRTGFIMKVIFLFFILIMHCINQGIKSM